VKAGGGNGGGVEPDGERAAASGHETSTAIAVLLAVAAVLAAAIGARGAALADEGSDRWHEAVRVEIKYGAALLEDTRFVYEEVAPQAFQLLSASIQADELDRQARAAPSVRALLATEAGTQRQLALATVRENRSSLSLKYLRPGPTYDVARRLADERNANPALTALDAGEVEHEGSQLKRQSSDLFAAAIPAAFAFLCGALAHGFHARRRWLLPLGFALCAASLVLALIVELSF